MPEMSGLAGRETVTSFQTENGRPATQGCIADIGSNLLACAVLDKLRSLRDRLRTGGGAFSGISRRPSCGDGVR